MRLAKACLICLLLERTSKESHFVSAHCPFCFFWSSPCLGDVGPFRYLALISVAAQDCVFFLCSASWAFAPRSRRSLSTFETDEFISSSAVAPRGDREVSSQREYGGDVFYMLMSPTKAPMFAISTCPCGSASLGLWVICASFWLAFWATSFIWLPCLP